jgi:UDP-galactopyranose mutase
MFRRDDFVVVGAGFAGAVCAERLAHAGFRVRVVENRPHVGGNAFDRLDAHGRLIHPYGPHIFHTNSEKVFGYLSRFTEWRFYEHRVLACLEGVLYPFPINITTLNRLYGLDLDERGAEAWLERVRESISPVTNSEDVVLNRVGRDLCEKFFSGYTRKHWGRELKDLSPSVAARIPVRTNFDDRYFTDIWQFMPAQGYTALFERMLDHPQINVELGVDYFLESHRLQPRLGLIYTGPIDAYFNYSAGRLGYRSLRFEHLHEADCERLQAVGTVNYPSTEPYTRVTEFKHLTGERGRGTSLVREFPSAEGEPFYPIPNEEYEARFQKYREMARGIANVKFVGRLAQYRYFNMDQVVAAALACIEDLLGNRGP